MRILKEGDKGRAVCPTCEALTELRYEYRPFRLEKSGVEVPDVLVGVCTRCHEIVTVPAQSTPKLKEARDRERPPFKARIPRHLDDALRLVAEHYDVPFSSFCAAMIRFYLRELGTNEQFARRVSRLTRSELTKGRADAELTVRVEPAVLEAAWERAREAGVGTKTAMVKGVIVAATEDVSDGRARARRRALEGVAAAV